MDGVPVFNLVRETMPAVVIEGFRGVINATCNYILSELERGKEFDQALAEMQARGIAEANRRTTSTGGTRPRRRPPSSTR